MIQLTYLVHNNAGKANSLVSDSAKQKFHKLIDLISSFFAGLGKQKHSQQNDSSSPSLASKITQDAPEKKEIEAHQTSIIQDNEAQPNSTSPNERVTIFCNFDLKELRERKKELSELNKKKVIHVEEKKPKASPGIVLSSEEERVIPQAKTSKKNTLILQPEDYWMMFSPHFVPEPSISVFVKEKKTEIKNQTPTTPRTIPIDPYQISLPKTVGTCLGEVKKSIRNYTGETDPSEKLRAAQKVLAAYDALTQHKDYKTKANPLLRDLFAEGSSEEEREAKLSDYEQGRKKFETEVQNLKKQLSQ